MEQSLPMQALTAHLQDAAQADGTTPAALGYQPRHIVLVGTGMPHLPVLHSLAAHPLAEVRITLVSPWPRTLYAPMLPGLVTGQYSADKCAIPIEPLVRRAGVHWLQRHVHALDANTRTLHLDDGSALRYDWLSVDTAGTNNREHTEATLPGAREHGLFVHPLETFAALWPRVCDMASSRALRVTVIGPNTEAMELAVAVRLRLPNAAVSWVGGTALSTDPLAQRLARSLRSAGITVIHENAVALSGEAVTLSNGARLACDVPILAHTDHTPQWLATSALAFDDASRITASTTTAETPHTSPCSSTSHPEIFRVHQLAQAPTLVARLAAAAGHRPTPAPVTPTSHPLLPLRILYAGSKGIGQWGAYQTEARWLGWLKDWRDQRAQARLTVASPATE